MSASHLQPIEKMMKNLKVDPSAQLTNTNLAPSKDGGASPSDATSCISSTGEASGSAKESDIDHESLITDRGVTYPTTSYYGYYYPGYDGTYGEFDNQGYYVGTDGMEIQYPVMQAENGSLLYFMPGFQPGYDPYSPYLPVTTIGVDGQYYGQQSYPTSPVFTSPLASPGYYPSPLSYGSEFMQSPYLWDPSFPVTDSGHVNAYGGNPEISASKPNLSAPTHTRVSPSKTFPRSEFGNLEIKAPSPSPDNHLKTVDKLGSNLRHDPILTKGYFPSSRFPVYQHASGGLLYPTTPTIKSNGRGWGGTEKLKTKAKVNGVGEFSLLNDHRARTTVNAKVTDENENSISIATIIKRDQYNLPDFTTKYEDALFFVIKSYSEDDIHKSIKYNVWASTPNGNKKLDSAYQEALERTTEKGGKCPIFLFFSVNASGQFCGVAEMIGPVDFNKNMNFWQQDKWTGFFPVKWHIIKDVPNPQLRHIILENNDNKPVTNSRDTQEVRFPQGIEMLGIFKNYVSKTSILDDFDFYESRQKVMQDKRIRPSTTHFDHIQKAEEINTDLQSIDLSTTKDIGKHVVVEKAKE